MKTGPCWVLVAVLATQSACVAEIRAQCPVLSDPRPASALPHDFAQLDGLIAHRALQMMYDVDQLHGSATTSFHIVFAMDTLPLLCGRMAQARELARAGQLAAAGRKYQALLVASEVMELAVAVHAVVEYADAVGDPSLVLVQTLETFGNQMTPILEAALTEDPGRIQAALKAQPGAFTAWAEYLELWSTHLRADAERMEVAKRVWDISIGVIAAYETAGALAEVAATGGPPLAPALAAVGGSAELTGAAYVELAESVRRLIASGALDAAVVATLSSAQMSQAKPPAWTSYGGKHVAPAKTPWGQVVEGTQSGPAKYAPGTDVEALERQVWEKGIPVTNGKPWRVMEFEQEIGASGGRASRWVRVEESADTIHGHPITEAEFRALTRQP